MAGEKEGNVWPLPKFYFSVDIGDMGTDLRFREVSGLETETQVIECRAGNFAGKFKVFSTIKMPGIAKFGNVTLKQGVFVKDNKFFERPARCRAGGHGGNAQTIPPAGRAGCRA